tara:strand:- start:174 stop:560 length:387 start_codon:yes stop_codon:yes gene_type:complete
MTSKSFLIFTVVITFVSFVVWFILQHQKYENEVIKVNVTLQNNCELIDSAFMVSTYPKGKKAQFENKKAVMYLKRSSKIHLQANDKYEGFHYSSVPVKVKSNLILEANCTEEGRLEDIFKSFEKQFKK